MEKGLLLKANPLWRGFKVIKGSYCASQIVKYVVIRVLEDLYNRSHIFSIKKEKIFVFGKTIFT